MNDRNEEIFKSMRRGDESSLEYMLELLSHNAIPDEDLNDVIDIFERRFLQYDDVISTQAMGVAYFHGRGCKQDIQKAKELFERIKHQKRVDTYLYLSLLCDLDKDYNSERKSLYYIRKSAELGHQFAQYMLGRYYLDPASICADETKGLYWMSQSAKQGCSLALEFFCERYESHGDSEKVASILSKILKEYNEVPSDFIIHLIDQLNDENSPLYNKQDADKWLKYGALQGNIACLERLCIKIGLSGLDQIDDEDNCCMKPQIKEIEENKEVLESLISKAEEYSSVSPLLSIVLSFLYSEGVLVEKDEVLANSFFLSNLEKGDSLTYYLLAKSYEEGNGFISEKDIVKAFVCMRVSFRCGRHICHGESVLDMKTLLKKMTKDELKSANKLWHEILSNPEQIQILYKPIKDSIDNAISDI